MCHGNDTAVVVREAIMGLNFNLVCKIVRK